MPTFLPSDPSTIPPAALIWFRQDLRLTDHPALHAALRADSSASGRVIPVFVLDDDAPVTPGAASRWWLHHSLAALDRELRARGSRLVLRRGKPAEVLPALAAACGANRIHCSRVHAPGADQLDARLASRLAADGVKLHVHDGALLHDPARLRTAAGDPYRVFTPFWRTLLQQLQTQTLAPLPAPDRLPAPAHWPESLSLADLDLLPRIDWTGGFSIWQPGEAGALRRLQTFLDSAVAAYREMRDRPDVEGSSRLSPHLHFGEISPLQILAALRASGIADTPGGAAFLREVGWRDFAHHLLHHYPHTVDSPLDARYAGLPWRNGAQADADLAAWQRGATGIPIVDAGLRELWHTGWMHNRVRMIAASLLTKHLLIPWQAGAHWFLDTLVDADLASNTLGWQWVAGCGADAAPYFRVFNPVLQAQKFDPQGDYIARWVPELAALPPAQRHAPWTAGLFGVHGYPPPIVDLARGRERALAAYAMIRQA